jgi:hypothetical protein
MRRFRLLYPVIFLATSFFGFHTSAQTTPEYDTLVHQGNTQLQAGSNDSALTTARSAIKLNTERWEAYALAGGALMNLKRYEEAADNFSHAIDHAPDAKQTGLRDLRKQCLLAESGTAPATPPPAASEPVPSQRTTQAEVVLWKTIENSTNPDDFKSYLDQHPHGAFVGLAQRHLAAAEAKADQDRRILSVPLQASVWVGSEDQLDKHGTVKSQRPVLVFFLDSGQLQVRFPNRGDAVGIEANAASPIDELRGKYLPHNWTTNLGNWQSNGTGITVHYSMVGNGEWFAYDGHPAAVLYNATRSGDLMEGTWSCPRCKDQGPFRLRRLDPNDAAVAAETVHKMWTSIFW